MTKKRDSYAPPGKLLSLSRLDNSPKCIRVIFVEKDRRRRSSLNPPSRLAGSDPSRDTWPCLDKVFHQTFPFLSYGPDDSDSFLILTFSRYPSGTQPRAKNDGRDHEFLMSREYRSGIKTFLEEDRSNPDYRA